MQPYIIYGYKNVCAFLLKEYSVTLDELKKLVENETIEMEFKTTTGEIKPACQTLCAFLNYLGGFVFIGVKNDGRLVGQMVTDNTRLEIANELEKIEPSVRVKVNYVPVTDQKMVICLQVAEGAHMPYVYDGKPYERIESSTRKMSQTQYNQLLSKQNQLNHSWERFDAENYTFDDLDHNLILNMIRKSVENDRLPEIAMREEISSVLEKLKVLEQGRVKNAAAALFGKEFLPHYPQCRLQMARFVGTDRDEFLDNDFLYGNVFELLENAMLFVKRHLPIAAKIISEQLERVETPLIPLKAVREAMINAVCHREYSVYGGSIKLAIYEDRLEITNNGGLLPGITLQKIKSGCSELRNPIIADVLFRCGLIERWGRGINEIIDKCIDAGDPEPEFECDEYHFHVTFRFSASMKPEVILIGEKNEPITKFTVRQQEIIKILALGESKASNIMSKLSHIIPDRTLRYELGILKKQQVIDSKGTTKNTIWFIKK